MASITIRQLEENTKRKLRMRAALHGRSMEQEAREILKTALNQPEEQPDPYQSRGSGKARDRTGYQRHI